MGFKSIEIIIGTPLVLSELLKYLDKMIMLATFGPLGINPVTIPSFFRGTFFLSKALHWGQTVGIMQCRIPLQLNCKMTPEVS